MSDGDPADDGGGPDAAGLSRRTLLGGLVGVGALAVGAGIVATRDPGDAGGASTTTTRPAPELSYGPEARQRGALHLPAGHGPAAAPIPVVVLVHGGFWRSSFERSLMDPLVGPVLARGWAAWNVDYRGSDDDGGGWPGTFTDVAAAVDHLAEIAEAQRLDLGRVAIAGHSAGGTLALWAAGRRSLPEGAPGAEPIVGPIAAVSLAGVTSLAAGWIDDLGRGAVDELMGGAPEGEREQDYLLASPSDLLPLDVAQLLIHGAEDPVVPPRQSTAHAERARAAGDVVALRVLDGIGHFEVIDPDSQAWRSTLSWLAPRLA